ncbi:MAG: CARDB domain-containing protein [Acidobacteriota bacterium]
MLLVIVAMVFPALSGAQTGDRKTGEPCRYCSNCGACGTIAWSACRDIRIVAVDGDFSSAPIGQPLTFEVFNDVDIDAPFSTCTNLVALSMNVDVESADGFTVTSKVPATNRPQGDRITVVPQSGADFRSTIQLRIEFVGTTGPIVTCSACNVNYRTVEITVPDGANATDLVVEPPTYEFLPDHPQFNTRVTARAVNVGAAPVDSTVILEWKLDDPGRDWVEKVRCSALDFNANGSCQFEELVWREVGSNRIDFWVDRADRVTESMNDNNQAVLFVEIPEPAADLQPVSASLAAPATVGAPATVLVNVRNGGNRSSVATEVELCAASTCTRGVLAALAPGASSTAAVLWTPSSVGPIPVIVAVDPDDDVVELTNANNALATTLQAGAPLGDLPDFFLEPSSITVSPSSPQTLTSMLVYTIRVHNEAGAGDLPAGQTLQVDLDIDGNNVRRFLITEGIAAGGWVERQHVGGALGAGLHNVSVEANPDQILAEQDDNYIDNSRTLFFNVSGSPGDVSCAGTWTLTGVGHDDVQSTQGSVVADASGQPCEVYWGNNQPTGVCWETVNPDNGFSASWYRDGNTCPVRVIAINDQGTFEYTVSIDPPPQ